jgi:hypothetical protein
MSTPERVWPAPEWRDVRHCEQRAYHAGRVLYLSVGHPHVFCYSDGEYLGTEPTVEAARRLCETGKRRDYVMGVIETTEEQFKANKLKVAKWEKLDKVEWRAPPEGDSKLPQRIRELDKKTFAVYRDGQYLGSEATLELAQKRAALGTRSDKNRVMQLWEHAHPDELPPFLQLTPEERAEYWLRHPPQPRAVVGAPKAVGGAGVPVVPATAAARARAALVEDAGGSTAKPTRAKRTGDVPTGTIKVLNGANPKKPGSGAAKRWDLLFSHDGKTVAEFAAAGGNLETLANAMTKGNVEVVP